MTADQAKAVCDDAARVPGPRIVSVRADSVIQAAPECGLTAADAEFVAAAREPGVRPATTDRAVPAGAGDVAVVLGAR